MKKLIYLLAAFTIIFVVAACGQSNDEENGNTTPIENTGNNESTNNENVDNEVDENSNNDLNNDENSNVDENELKDNSENNANNNNNSSNNENTNNESTETIDGVSLFFADDQLMDIYRVNTGITVTANEAGAKEAYNIWLSGPEASNLVSLLPDTAVVQSVEFRGNVAHVSFNDAILDANLGSSGELMVTEQIAAIASQFGYNETQILIEGEMAESFLGHMTISEPISAPNVDQYEVAQ